MIASILCAAAYGKKIKSGDSGQANVALSNSNATSLAGGDGVFLGTGQIQTTMARTQVPSPQRIAIKVATKLWVAA